ncbi:MAG: Uma2 family endonuclease [Fimbriimonadales bacterium]|nr:Uma2 family endonuclease [Fimbriimonadales bacterium]MDW8051650.1 Uma2 family endonuclease [Armatimonadota bacterium]
MATATQAQQIPSVVDWEGYLNLPSELTSYEIIDGELRPLPTPTFKHQLIVRQFVLVVAPQLNAKQLGELITAPYDVVIRRQPLRTRQPDLMFLSRARFGNFAQIADAPRIEQPPDLAVEVLSPSDTFVKWLEKLWDYHALGVPEVWAVDIERRSIEVLVREESGYRWAGSYAGEQLVQSTVLKDIELKPADVFKVLDELEPQG